MACGLILPGGVAFLVGAASNRSERNLRRRWGRIEQLERSADEQAKTSLALLQSDSELLRQVHQPQTAALTALGGLEHVNAELNVIRRAAAPGVPNPVTGTDADSAAQEH